MAKILIAEDDLDIRELLAFTLKLVGYDVLTVNNGLEAVAAASQALPDLILLDLKMPRMNGAEACQKIKEDPRLAQTPVAFLSGRGQEEGVEMMHSLGAVAYIEKPFETEDLIERVAALLG